MVFFLITCICLLLPIFISCAIYLKLICNKKKWFLNEITFEENNQENINKNKPDSSTKNSESNKIETGNEMEMQKILELQTEQKKCQAQILAAERSQLTNLILGTLFCITFSILMLVPKTLRVYLTVIGISIMKAAMPLLTTLANYGTVQFIASQYWNYIREKNFHPCKNQLK
jgi:hypothetical protein